MSQSQPFDAAELPLAGLRLIEASAGTGKTFSLAGLYLRLIVERQASVRDILVMTFTRAATQELRDRIRARLTRAALIAHDTNQARDGHPEDDFTRRILARATEPLGTLARRLAEAATRIDEATIVTIHGFAQRAATENAFESALAFDRGEAVDDAGVFLEAATDYWRAHVFGADAANGDLLGLFDSPAALYQAIAPVLTRPHAALVGIDKPRADDLLARLRKQWPMTVAPLTEALAAARNNAAMKKNAPLNQAMAAYESPTEAVAALDTIISAALAANRLPVLGDWVRTLDAPRAAFKKTPKAAQAYADPLEALTALPILAELQPMARLSAIDTAARAVAARAEARKIERRQYSYDDLIVALHAALAHPRTGDALAAALYARWPYALVDEFQDTDPLQYASLSRIYSPIFGASGDQAARESGALLLIGDPKQAIYGFRGGDIYAYLTAARAAGEARYTLDTNFRSTPAVLAAIGALYEFPGADPFLVPEIDFPHVESGRGGGDRRLLDANGHERAALTFWQLTGGETEYKNGNTRPPSREHDTARLIDETVAAVADLLAGNAGYWQIDDADDTRTRPVVARDIAVLVNRHQEATALQAALAAQGIMAVCQHRASVFDSAQANDLRFVLRAMAQPDDARAVRAAQPTALIGQRLSDLIRLADDDGALQAAIEPFHALHETWQRRGVLAALEDLFIDAAPRLLARTDGERVVSNYLQLGELLAEAEAECFGMESLIHWLDERITAAAEGTLGSEDESQLRLESDAELVRIATVHSSKGLQYPIVFLPFAPWLGSWSQKNAPDKPPLVFHQSGEETGSAANRTAVDLLGDTPAHAAQAVLEARSEALRLLYVALTRAEQALIVGWREPAQAVDPGALADLLYRDDTGERDALSRLRAAAPEAIAVETIETTRPAAAAPVVRPHDVGALGSARHDLPTPRPRWSTYSFSKLAHAPTDNAAADLPEPGAADELANAPAEPSNDKAAAGQAALPILDSRLSGVRFGSAVHDLLEAELKRPERDPNRPTTAWPAPGTPADADTHRTVFHTLRRYGLIGDDDTDARIADTADLVARTLHTPLPQIGPLAGLSPNNLLAEMEFMLRLSGSRLGALIDTLRDAGYLPAALGGNPHHTLYGLMQGFIDLVVEANGAYYILDYKTNRLGDTPAAYRDDALAAAMTRAHYDLQYLIYTVALHRHLARTLADYDPATHLGGVQYLFVRAMDGTTVTGVYTDRPPVPLIERLDALFDNTAEAV